MSDDDEGFFADDLGNIPIERKNERKTAPPGFQRESTGGRKRKYDGEDASSAVSDRSDGSAIAYRYARMSNERKQNPTIARSRATASDATSITVESKEDDRELQLVELGQDPGRWCFMCWSDLRKDQIHMDLYMKIIELVADNHERVPSKHWAWMVQTYFNEKIRPSLSTCVQQLEWKQETIVAHFTQHCQDPLVQNSMDMRRTSAWLEKMDKELDDDDEGVDFRKWLMLERVLKARKNLRDEWLRLRNARS